MAELDPMQHEHEQAPAKPQPARPILASHLLDLEEQQRSQFVGNGKSERLSTKCAEIDELLGGGGVERGIVVGVSAGGSEGSLISLHLLATVLLEAITRSSTQATLEKKAVVIDSTGAFPISLLAKVIRARILEEHSDAAIRSEESGNYESSRNEGSVNQDESEVDAKVHSCLEMVALCRVFDIEGVWEVLGEIRSSPAVSGQLHEQESRETVEENVMQSQRGQHMEKGSPEKPAEIIDSEEEEESPTDEVFPDKLVENSAREAGSNGDGEESGTEIMIIDSMTHLINDLFSQKEKTDAHTLLSLLSQTLHNLTHTQNILTILHNSTVPVRSSNAYASNSTSNAKQQPYSYSFRGQPQPPTHQTSPSVFPSNQVKPALGQIFSQFPELHLFLSELPKHRTDAELLYGQEPALEPGPESGPFSEPALESEQEVNPEAQAAARTRTAEGLHTNTQRVRYCTIAEILKDETPCLGSDREREPDEMNKMKQDKETDMKTREFGWRERRWCALESSADGVMLKSAFAIKTNLERRDGNNTGSGAGSGARASGREVDSRVGLGVGEVAKVYGFGGRRV